jgi:aquaporin NIP
MRTMKKSWKIKTRKYVAECLATFFLVFCGTGAIIINEHSNETIGHLGIAVAFGLIVTIMIFTFGDISGAHMNPVVTLVFILLKIHPKKDLIPFVYSQIAGALLASLALCSLFPENKNLGNTLPNGSELQSFMLELIMTFLLVLVILFSTQGSEAKMKTAALTIGATILIEALIIGPISGASMNPTRTFAPALVSGHLEHLWIYILGPTIGGLTAAYLWKLSSKMNPN